jgi:aldehyde:ferredoxin oxidoreductase
VFADPWAETADLLAKVTGWDVTADELRATARRVVTAKKLSTPGRGGRRPRTPCRSGS